jgi:hypothetical protein
VPKGDNACILH